jgi:hypothetical protein
MDRDVCLLHSGSSGRRGGKELVHCPTAGCDGMGHLSGSYGTHRRQDISIVWWLICCLSSILSLSLILYNLFMSTNLLALFVVLHLGLVCSFSNSSGVSIVFVVKSFLKFSSRCQTAQWWLSVTLLFHEDILFLPHLKSPAMKFLS